MKIDANLSEAIRKYLLRELSPEDSSDVEERLLMEDAVYQELLVVEDELIDQYLTGELSESQREFFKEHFLTTPERHQKLRFAGNLKKYVGNADSARSLVAAVPDDASSDHNSEVAEPPPKKWTSFRFLPFGNPTVSYSLTAAMVVVLAIVSILVFKNIWKPTPARPGKILAVELTPGLTRDDVEIKKISIPPGTDAVRLELRLANADQYQSYRAVLQTSDGLERFKIGDLKALTTGTSMIVPVELAAGLLPRGNYNLKLSGLNSRGEYDDIGRYSFRISGN